MYSLWYILSDQPIHLLTYLGIIKKPGSADDHVKARPGELIPTDEPR